MIKMDDLKLLLKLVLLSADIRHEKPISLLIVSKSGNGKTELITSFQKSTSAYVTDITYTGLLGLMDENKRLRHIIIPDFIKITQKKRSTSDNFISLLNALIEEGVGKIKLYNLSYDLKGRNIGLITATTKESFAQHKKQWSKFGFVQRMVIVSYDYSDGTIEEIMDSINKEEYLKNKKDDISGFTGEDIESDRSFNQQLNKYVDKNFRTLRHLQTLCKSHALMKGRKKVTQEDVDKIIYLTKYMNLEYTKI